MAEISWLEDRWVTIEDYKIPERFALRQRSRAGAPGWELEFEVRGGVPRCRRVVIEAADEGREVRSADLRALQVEDLLEGAAANVAHREGEGGELRRDLDLFSPTGDWRKLVHDVRAKRREDRRRVTDDVLRGVAEVYRANVEQHPTQAVADHLGVADRTARLYVRRARDAGFLGESIKGKGGEV